MVSCADTKKQTGDKKPNKTEEVDSNNVTKPDDAQKKSPVKVNTTQSRIEKSGESMDSPSLEEAQEAQAPQEIKHGSPDQSLIDSIKAAKQKGKK
tara:strand:+ start:409 stop:693 length:285 start_codon:yes stop_codon:yes gene_type:complete